MKYINKHIYIMILYFNLIYSIFDMNYESKNFDCEMCKYDFKKNKNHAFITNSFACFEWSELVDSS